MDVVVLIGRILFVIVFLTSAIGHFTKTDDMAGYAQSKGVPSARIGVMVSGALMLLAGLSILFGIWADLGFLLVVIVLIPTTLMMHQFWTETEAGNKQSEMINFTKNLALIGAALMLFALFAHTRYLGLTITGPLFRM